MTMSKKLKSNPTELFHELNHTGKHHYRPYPYAPTNDHEVKTVEMFYAELEKAMDKKSCRQSILMGDFITKLGVKHVSDNMKCIWLFGTGNRNERGK